MERYRDIVPDYPAFREALDRPLPTTARVNRTKATMTDVVDALEAIGASVEQFDWFPDGCAVDLSAIDGEPGIGNTLPHYLGWIHGQEEVSMVPPVVLDPSRDDVVLDLCAAPGSKATQLAQDAEAVVANDDDFGRLAALRSNADRLGCTNVAVTNVDGRRFPGRDRFDAALVDVPCTAEGTVRKQTGAAESADQQEASTLAGLQRQLLERAIELVAPGGTVVYSTCTFAPEENEAVVSQILEDDALDVTAEPVDVGLDGVPGIRVWRDDRYHAGVEHARRFYPHLNDTGGFFVADLTVS